MLVDSHCHLDFPDFAAELDAVVARARAAGIGRPEALAAAFPMARVEWRDSRRRIVEGAARVTPAPVARRWSSLRAACAPAARERP